MTEGDDNYRSITSEKNVKKALNRLRRKQRRKHYSSRDKEYDKETI